MEQVHGSHLMSVRASGWHAPARNVLRCSDSTDVRIERQLCGHGLRLFGALNRRSQEGPSRRGWQCDYHLESRSHCAIPEKCPPHRSACLRGGQRTLCKSLHFVAATAPPGRLHLVAPVLATIFSDAQKSNLQPCLNWRGARGPRVPCYPRPTVSQSRGPSGGRPGRMSRSQQDSWNVFGILENALGISGSQHSVPGRGPPPRGELHDSRQRGAFPSDADNVRRIRGQSERLSAFRGSPHLLPFMIHLCFSSPLPFPPPLYVRSSNCSWHSGSGWRRRRRTDELRGGKDVDCAGLQG